MSQVTGPLAGARDGLTFLVEEAVDVNDERRHLDRIRSLDLRALPRVDILECASEPTEGREPEVEHGGESSQQRDAEHQKRCRQSVTELRRRLVDFAAIGCERQAEADRRSTRAHRECSLDREESRAGGPREIVTVRFAGRQAVVG